MIAPRSLPIPPDLASDAWSVIGIFQTDTGQIR